jgi:protein arginine kinase activator
MSYSTCEHCHKNVATVTVIEIPPATDEGPGSGSGEGALPHEQQSLCEICAQAKNLPHAPVVKKTLGDIWKLLQASGAKAKASTPQLTCPDCGMTREELRTRGRIGCARDYEIFADDIHEILERVHGATEHVGRLPGLSTAELDRMQQITSLKRRLDAAIRDEAYENAARIRDELQALDETV